MADNRRPQDKWRQGGGAPGAPSAPRASSRTSRLFIGAFVFAALAGVVIGLIFFLRPAAKPIYLSIPVTEYADHNWPINAFAQQDAEALRQLFGADSAVAFQSQERELILRELNQLADRSRGDDKGRPIVVHLSANALVHDGAPYVLPGDAKVGAPGTWIKLEELLDPLRRAQGSRLLILDLRPVVDARLGSLSDDLADVVHQSLAAREQADDLKFHVVVASGPGSTAVVSRELRRSAVGYFLERGLAGAADGWNAERHKDGRTSALELFPFVRDHAATFASRLNVAPQLPVRHGHADDFVIIPVPPGGPPAPPKPEYAEEYPTWLLEGWRERDRWRDQFVHRRLQRTYRHLEAILRRAEEQWLGGGNLGKAQAEFEDELRELKAVRARYPEPIPPATSIARAEKVGLKASDADAAVRRIVEIVKLPPPKKDKDKDKEDNPELVKLWAALKEKPPDPAAAAAILFKAAIDRDELNLEQLKLLVQTAQGLPSRPRHAEMAVLRFVTEIDPKRLRLWEPGTISRVLLTTQQAETAAAVDGRCLPWIQSELQKTDNLRRAALVALVTGDADDRDKARGVLDKCYESYKDIVRAAKELERAFAQIEETRVLLAADVAFAAPDRKAREELDALWTGIVGEFRELLPLTLPPATAGLPNIQQLKDKSDILEYRREQYYKLLKIPPSASAADVGRWLGSPLWSADRRAQHAGRMRETGLALVEQALRSPPDKPGTGESPPIDQAARDESARRRARRALDVLTLVGDPEATKLDAKLDALRKAPVGMRDLGHAIQRRWSEQLPQRYMQSKDLGEQVRIGWAVHPFDLPALPRSGDTFPRDAAAEHRRQQEKLFQDRLAANRYQLDAREFAKLEGDGAKHFATSLEELARELLNWSP